VVGLGTSRLQTIQNAGSPDLSPSQRARFSPRPSLHSQEPTEAPLKWRKFLRLLLQAMYPGITMSSRLRRVGAKSLERTRAVRGMLPKKGRQAPRRSGEPANGAASGHFRQASRLRDTSLTAGYLGPSRTLEFVRGPTAMNKPESGGRCWLPSGSAFHFLPA